MLKIIHRVNKIKDLKKIPSQYGVEVDLRAYGKKIILNHEAFKDGEDFETYMASYSHSFIVLNVKESGIEDRIINIMEKREIKNYFLLDLEFPYIYKSSKNGFKKIAIRYSEKEPINAVLQFKNSFEWVWIDTNTRLPLNGKVAKILKNFNTCLVCPERWNRPLDIANYAQKMKNLNFKPTAVMTSLKYVKEWEKFYPT